MKTQERIKTFSAKKLLLTILCAVIVSIFIGSTILFIVSVSNSIKSEIISCAKKESPILIELGKNYQNRYEYTMEYFEKEKTLYGENYPSEGLFLMELINHYSTNNIITVYSLSLIVGIVSGTLIYIIIIQKAKGKELIIELLLALIGTFLIIGLINSGTQIVLNWFIATVNPNIISYTYVYDTENHSVLLSFASLLIIIYLINMIIQKILVNKLNKQLNKK